MPVTSPDSIYYADTSTTSNDVAVSAAEATSVQAAFARRTFKSYVWGNASQRDAQEASIGDSGYQSDTGAFYTYRGTGWVPELVTLEQNAFQYPTGTSVATGTTLITLNLAALPVASVVIFNSPCSVGNVGGATATAGLTFASTFGAPTSLSTESHQVLAGAWISIGAAFYLALPANVATTVTIRTVSSANLRWSLIGNYSRTAT